MIEVQHRCDKGNSLLFSATIVGGSQSEKIVAIIVIVMSTLKLTTMALSVYAHKPCHLYHSHHSPHHALNNFWVRSVPAPPSGARSSIGRGGNISSLALRGYKEKFSALFNDGWWRITTCAHLVHFKASLKILGFRGRSYYKRFSLGSKMSTSVEKRGFSAFRSESSGSDLVEDMGSESKDHRGGRYQDDSHAQNQSPSQQQRPKHPPKLLTLPTILTLARVAAVPLLVCTFYVDSRWGTTATTSIFIAAAITDWLDGYLARKMGLGTAFGAFLDPVADKLMVATTLVLLCTRPLEVSMFAQSPWLLTIPAIVVIGREITMSAVREWAASQNGKLLEAVAVNNLGKWKTATQMIALTILLATRDGSLGGPESLVAFGVTLLYISAGLALWSLVVYMCKIWKFLLR